MTPSNTIKVNVDEIPDYTANALGEATYNAVTAFFEQPDAEAKFEEWLAKRNAIASAEEERRDYFGANH